jgi:hypothetical protein
MLVNGLPVIQPGSRKPLVIANDDVTLIIGEVRLGLRAIPANDPASIEAANQGF